MSVIAQAVKHLLAAGVTGDQLVAAIADMEAAQAANRPVDEQAERRRAADRERKREGRLRNSADSAEDADTLEKDPPLSPPLSPAPHTPPLNPPSKLALPRNLSADFSAFWKAYPKQSGVEPAQAAFAAAVAAGADPKALIRAADRFARKMAEEKQEWRYIPGAGRWIKDGTWRSAAFADPDPGQAVHLDPWKMPFAKQIGDHFALTWLQGSSLAAGVLTLPTKFTADRVRDQHGIELQRLGVKEIVHQPLATEKP